MSRRYWDDDELNALHHGFEFHMGGTWADAVNDCASAGTVRAIEATPAEWAAVAAIVGTRTGDQCAKRLQTERRQEQERRAASVPPIVCPTDDDGPQPVFEFKSPSRPRRKSVALMMGPCSPGTVGGVECVDVSPYLGQAKGRIVLSFNGRGAA